MADLADLHAVRRALDELDGLPLQGIVANAGLTTIRDQRSAQGFELTFAVNVLAHQLVLSRLRHALVPGARVVVLSSGTHEPDNRLARLSGIPVPRWVGPHALALPDQAPEAQRLRDGRQRYSTSKLGNVLQARALQAVLRHENRDADVFALDPGLMIDTDLVRELPAPLRWIFRGLGYLLTPVVDNMRLSTTSSRHVVDLLDAPRWHGRGFEYLDGDRAKPPSPDAQRDDLAAELWRECTTLLELDEDPDCQIDAWLALQRL